MVSEPAGLVWQFQAAGMRMELKPAALTALMNAWLTAGFPQAVSPHWASSVLPRFQPTVIWLATCGAVGRVCAKAEMDVKSSAKNAAALRHFAAEGLRSDMRIPPVVINPSRARHTGPPRIYAPTTSLMQSGFTGQNCRWTSWRPCCYAIGVSYAAVSATFT